MNKIPALLALAASFSPALAAEAPVPEQSPLAFMDVFRASGYGTFGMDFDKSPGELGMWQAEVQTFLSKPLSLGGDFSFLPTFRYEFTSLRYDGTPLGFPLQDQDLHSLELPLYLLHSSSTSPWIYGAF